MPTQKPDTLVTFQNRIESLEKERDSRIWCMVHHSGNAHICGPMMRAIYQGRPVAGHGQKLEILLHSPGGHPDYAYQAMKFFRRRFKEVNVIVPIRAKSAATLMCLGADKIYMGEFGDLGPIDIQIDDPVEEGEKGVSPLDEFKSLEYMRDMAIEWMAYYAAIANQEYGISIKQGLEQGVPLVTGLMQPILSQVEPLEIGLYRRALAIGEEYGKRMLALAGKHDDELVRKLVWDYPSHSFCIDFEEALGLGLPVERLSADHDHKFSEAVLGLERGSHHGFATTGKAQTTPKAAPKSKPLQASRHAAPAGATGRVNGAGDNGGAKSSPAS